MAKATTIKLFSLRTPQMRAFHLSWLAFFVCFFAWFAVAPLMPVIKGEFGLSKERSEEHTSELQSLMRISYAVFCLKNKNKKQIKTPCYYYQQTTTTLINIIQTTNETY